MEIKPFEPPSPADVLVTKIILRKLEKVNNFSCKKGRQDPLIHLRIHHVKFTILTTIIT